MRSTSVAFHVSSRLYVDVLPIHVCPFGSSRMVHGGTGLQAQMLKLSHVKTDIIQTAKETLLDEAQGSRTVL